ncbi:MAG: T9SS type A sorting domain-containing protein, partial [Bacteroidales bacterium]|nr:T9SS type A sorting domain-containing protein [Bacteroidales bacterium]
TEIPTNFTATKGDINFYSAELLLQADDNISVINYAITVDGVTTTTQGVAGSSYSAIMKGLYAETEYTFSIVATDIAGNAAANNPLEITLTTPAASLGLAPVPTVEASRVISIYSDTYDNLTGTNFNPGWGQETQYTPIALDDNNNIIHYSNLNYQGIEYDSTDASAMTHIHIDVYTPDAADLNLSIISPGKEFPIALTPIVFDEWNSYDIALADYVEGNADIDLAGLIQLKFEGAGNLYIDNIYFYTINYELLETALIAASANADTVKVSTDGADILTTSEWLTQAELTTYETAIATAQAVADDADATQQEIDAAVTALATATTTFDAAKSAGTKDATDLSNVNNIELNISPNPSSGIFTINITNEYTLNVISVSGKTIMARTINASNNSIDLSGNKAGVYILKFENNTENFTSRVIIK